MAAPGISSPSRWYDYYEGAVYGVDRDAEPCFDTKHRVLSLCAICSRRIVSDSTLTKTAISLLPQALMPGLMREALLCHYDSSVHVLLQHWPYQGVVLSEILDRPFASLKPLHCRIYHEKMIQESMRYTTTLAHSFMESLKKGQSNLRFLDMSDFPMAELMLVYISSHCLLMFNEVRQDCMLNLYHRSVEEGKIQPNQELEKLEMSFPQDLDLSIKVDAFVATQSSLGEVARALKVSSFGTSRMRLMVSKLSITCLGEPSINILLSLINPEHLTGLQLRHNSLDFPELQKLAHYFRTFCNLTSLDLSRNCLNVRSTDHIATLREVLSSLPRLQRLDLASNSLRNRLGSVLEGIQHPLTYLRLAACRLTEADQVALINWPLLPQLEELDLSDNKFVPTHLGAMCSRSHLRVLEMEGCLPYGTLPQVLPQLVAMEQLQYLNLAYHTFVYVDLVQPFVMLSQLPQLQVVKISRPHDGLDEREDVEGVLRRRENLMDCLQKALNDCRSKQHPPITLDCFPFSYVELL